LEHPALSHIERTLGDAYRKEIDQEENVWRSLPFFAATLALELAALFQLIARLPPLGTITGWLSLILSTLAGLLMFAALCLLAACIASARYRYVEAEPALLRDMDDLIRAELAPENRDTDNPVDALATLKRRLASQFGDAAYHNRQINKRRRWRRDIAGLLVVGSVLTILLLVTVAFAYYIPNVSDTGDGHGPAAAAAPIRGSPDRASESTGAGHTEAAHSAGAADADHH
jgi:type VI protein secretion system component VasK